MLEFLNDLLDSEADKFEEEDYNVRGFSHGQLFNKIFQLLDYDNSGRISKTEVVDYFVKIVGDQKTEGPEGVPDEGKPGPSGLMKVAPSEEQELQRFNDL